MRGGRRGHEQQGLECRGHDEEKDEREPTQRGGGENKTKRRRDTTTNEGHDDKVEEGVYNDNDDNKGNTKGRGGAIQ